MDLAKIAELLGTKTEGDPAFQETEEAQFYTHMLRMDDVDNRATAVQSHTEQVSEEIRQEAETTDTEPAYIDANTETVAEPAETESVFVAPDADPSQALVDTGEDAEPVTPVLESGEDAQPSAAEVVSVDDAVPATLSESEQPEYDPAPLEFQEAPEAAHTLQELDPGPDTEPAAALLEAGDDAEPVMQQQSDQATDAAPSVLQSDDEASDASPAEILTEQGPDAEASPPVQDEPQEAVPNALLSDENVLVATIPESNGEATMIVPESLINEGFMDVWQVFEREVQRPDIQIGEIPIGSDDLTAGADEIVSSTEGAERMLSALSRDLLMWDRR